MPHKAAAGEALGHGTKVASNSSSLLSSNCVGF